MREKCAETVGKSRSRAVTTRSTTRLPDGVMTPSACSNPMASASQPSLGSALSEGVPGGQDGCKGGGRPGIAAPVPARTRIGQGGLELRKERAGGPVVTGTGGEGHAKPALRLRLALAPGVELGPGKAELLEAIRDTGSIAAAGRRMRMSYQRAWELVAALNGGFRAPLVEAAKGGAKGGGAVLTPLGAEVLAAYRRIAAAAEQAAAADLARLRAELAD
jgi:molybdate transport system regulatory protein